MAADTPRPNSAPIARALTKVVVYYVVPSSSACSYGIFSRELEDLLSPSIC